MRRVAEGERNATRDAALLDFTNGQNALTQAQKFNQAIDITGVVLTKLDGTAKGGIVLATSPATGHSGETRGASARPSATSSNSTPTSSSRRCSA